MVLLGFAWFNYDADQRRLRARLHVGGDHRRALGQPLPASRDRVPVRAPGLAAGPRAGARGLRDLPARVRPDAALQRRRPAQPAADRARRRADRPDARHRHGDLRGAVRARRDPLGAALPARRQLRAPAAHAGLHVRAADLRAGDLRAGRGRRSGVVRGVPLERADAVRVHRRADPQPALAPRRRAAREPGGAAGLAGTAGAGRRRGPAQARARPARRRAVTAGGAGVDVARGAQPRGRQRGAGAPARPGAGRAARRASPSCASWRGGSIRPC